MHEQLDTQSIINDKKSLEDYYIDLISLEPKAITVFVPDDGVEQKQAFLSGEIDNPHHYYHKLALGNYDDKAINEAGAVLIEHLNEGQQKQIPTYELFVDRYRKVAAFLRAAQSFNTAQSEQERRLARQKFMQLNRELYGEPDHNTYRTLLRDQFISAVHTAPDTTLAQSLKNDLETRLPAIERDHSQRFHPSHETVAWMGGVAQSLYGDMLKHTPEQASFTAAEVKDVFDTILRSEFGEAAEGWRVDLEKAQSIDVKSAEKRVVIPVDRADMGQEELRRLIVHELGVHVLRSITGESTDLHPLRQGLVGYDDSEEGLGKVMEQAIDGGYKEVGVDHYITVGLAYYEEMDFRQTYEVKWRLGALKALGSSSLPEETSIEKAKNTAYKQTMRIFRGTDELPWFKDLAYYNGSQNVWEHLEAIRGNELMLSLLLAGKADTTQSEQLRAVLESATRE